MSEQKKCNHAKIIIYNDKVDPIMYCCDDCGEFVPDQGEKFKNGMYGEMPIVQIGRFEISMMSDRKHEDRIWVRDGEDEGGEFKAIILEPYVEEFFNKHF